MKYAVIILIVLVLAGLIWWGVAASHKKQNSPSAPSLTKEGVGGVRVVFETNMGVIKVELNAKAAPKTAANMQKLVGEKFYDGLTFHRVIDGFMIQGGDPKGDGTGGPGYTVPAEIGLPHKAGAIATARLGDEINPTRASSGSQFFIVLSDAPAATLAALDAGGYTVFGQVTAGMDVVDAIGKVKTGANDKPFQPVIIKKAYLE